MKGWMTMKRISQRCMAILTAMLMALAMLTVLAASLPRESVSAESSVPTLHIGSVQIDMEQLEKDHYLVTVPITFPDNPGFEILQCGVSWDTQHMVALGGRCTNDETSPLFAYSPNNDFMWATYLGKFSGTDLFSVTFQLSEDVQVGESFPINGVYEDYNHNPAQYANSSMEHFNLEYISGSITIVNNVIPEVSLEIGEEGVAKASMRDLEENDYIVEVPIRATVNNGFCGMEFGVAWDNTQLIAEAPSGNTPDGLSLLPTFDNDSGTGWVQVFADERYTGSDICTLRFRVPDNAKPASSYEIRLTETGSGGEKADVTNSDNNSGTLNLCVGTIRITSTQPVSSYANGIVSLPDIEITPEDLAANDYLIHVPVCISKNSAFTQLEFGVSWNTNDLNLVDCICDDDKNLGMLTSYYGTGGGIWLPFLYRGKNGAYVGTSLCTISFRIRPDAEPGDVFELTTAESDGEGATAMIANIKGESGKIRLNSGSISIVSSERRDAVASVKVGDVAITMDQLEYDDYQVTVPIALTKNDGIASVAFGVSWDADTAFPMDAVSYNQECLGLQSNFYTDAGMIWLNYISIDPNDNYVYYNVKLGSIVLELSETVQPGDVIQLSAVNTAANGVAASAVDASGDSTIPLLESGSIRIIDDTITTEETTETTPPQETTTTTTTTITTSSTTESTSIESTSAESTTETTTTVTTQTTASATVVTETHTTTQKTGNRLERESLSIAVGKSISLTFLPEKGDGDDCVWLSNDPKIASLTAGNTPAQVMISGNAIGTTEVMVLYDGQVYTCKVTVTSGDRFGDINLDNTKDLTDLVLLNKCIAGSLGDLSSEALENADINQDDYIDCKDALLLLQQLLEAGIIA